MVGSIEDVVEAQIDKPQSGLVPSRIEPDQARIADELEGSHRPAGREKSEHRDHALPQPRQLRMDRKSGSIGLDGIFEPGVEHGLVPDHVDIVAQIRACEARGSLFIGGERGVGFERNSRGDHARPEGQAIFALAQFHKIRDPHGR